MEIIKFLGFFFTIAALADCGIKTKEMRVEGEVIKISGTMPTLVQSAGALVGNESVRIGDASLVYMVRTAI